MSAAGVDHLTGATVGDAPKPCRECMWWQTRPGREPADRRQWIETAEEVRDRVLEAARFIDPGRLGTTDDCGFSPFGDDTSTSRDTAFAKIRARVEGTDMASRELGV